MGQILELQLSVDSCLRFAQSAFDKGNYLLSLQNINEAMSLAYKKGEIHKVLEAYSKVFRETENNKSFKSVLVMNVQNKGTKDYYRMDFTEFLTYNESYVENEQLRQMSLAQMNNYNNIKTLFAERKYDEAIEAMSGVVLNSEVAIGIVECLKTAVSNDEKFRLDNYVIPLLEVLAHSQSYYAMIKLMLEGGRLTHDIMVDSVDYFLSEADSVVSLVMLGETFFSSNEIDIAKNFFEEALAQNPIEESCLYYMTVINLLLEKKEEADKFWDTYKQAYKITNPPIKLYERYFASDAVSTLVPYGILPYDFCKKIATELREGCPKDDFDEEFAQRFLELCMLTNDKYILDLLNYKKLSSRPVALQTCLKILKNNNITENIKKKVLMMIVDSGYEGRVTVLTDTAIVAFDMAKLHHRVNQWWAVTYKTLLRSLPFLDIYMPIKCSLLGSITKKLDRLIPDIEVEDFNFAIALLVFNYIKRLNINVDIFEVAKNMGLEVDEIALGLKKYDIKELYI